MLAEHRVATLVDVRRHPASRWVPWANGAKLAAALREAGVAYVHAPDLGGRRDVAPGSPNAGIKDPQLHGYADWMATPTFQAAVASLLARAAEAPVAVMCSEAKPEDCHRSLLADALVARGVDVVQATAPGQSAPHRMTPGARVRGTEVTYPGPPAQRRL